MEWNFKADLPIYSQLVQQIKLAIVSGIYLPGERLASVRELATEAGVNPNTMQRALAELERDGLVYSQRTAGRFVTEDKEMIETAKRALAQSHIQSFLEQMASLGFDRIDVNKEVVKVSIVGAGMLENAGVAAKMFGALYDADINIHMISTSETKVSVLLDESDANAAVQAIHDKFFEE